MKRSFKILILFIVSILFLTLSWGLILRIYGEVLKLPIFLDDWVMIWGIAHEKSIFFNPAKLQFFFSEFPKNYALRAGYVETWLTAIVYKNAGLNHFYYLYVGLVLKFFVSTAIFISLYIITKSAPTSFISGLLYAVNPLGSQSLTWFINYGIYIFLGLLVLSLPLFIELASGKLKFLIPSIIAVILLTYLYSERAFLLVGLVSLFFIIPKRIISLKQVLLASCLMVILVAAYLMLFGNVAGTTATQIIGRIHLGDVNISQGKYMFLTFPINIVSISILPGAIISKLLYIHKELSFLQYLPVTEFRFWNFLIFPLMWVSGIIFAAKRAKVNKCASIFWITLGLLWAIINVILRLKFFRTDWDWTYHFLFISSVYIIMFTLYLFTILRNSVTYGIYVKTLLYCLVFILVGYSLTWAVDPLIPPGSYNADRYVTLSVTFGVIYFGTFLGMFLTFISRKKSKVEMILGSLFVIAILLYTITSSMKAGKYYVNALLVRRSQTVTNKVLSNISNKVTLQSNRATLIMIEPWDIFEVLGILPPGGHSIELVKNDLDPSKLPLIYFDEKMLTSKYQEICGGNGVNLPLIYKFKVLQNGDVIDLTKTVPKITCKK